MAHPRSHACTVLSLLSHAVPWAADWNAEQHAQKPCLVGSCFGEQLISEAMGGLVAPNPRGRYVVRAEEIYPTEAFTRMPWSDSIVLKTRVRRGIRQHGAIVQLWMGVRMSMSVRNG